MAVHSLQLDRKARLFEVRPMRQRHVDGVFRRDRQKAASFLGFQVASQPYGLVDWNTDLHLEVVECLRCEASGLDLLCFKIGKLDFCCQTLKFRRQALAYSPDRFAERDLRTRNAHTDDLYLFQG